MKRKLLLLLVLMLLPCAALAQDVFTIDTDSLDMNSLNSDDYVAQHLSSSAQGLRVRKQMNASGAVRLTLTEMNSRTLIFDKDYGFQSGMFDSGVIYLPYMGEGVTPYLVTLYAGDYVYAMPFMQLQARLSHNGACTEGVRLGDLSASLNADWLMGAMLDLHQLRQTGSQTLRLCASNQYIVGTAKVRLSGDSLRVDVTFDPAADVELHEADVYVVTDCAAFSNGHFPASHNLGERVDVSGADAVLLYLPIQISYNPSGLPSFRYDANRLQQHFSLWNDSQGGWAQDDWTGDLWQSDIRTDEGWDSGWTDDGWSSGWDNTTGWEDSGWEEGAGW